MTQKYEVITRTESGKINRSAGKFKTYENAKRALRKYYKIYTIDKIVAYKIVNHETCEIVEQSGRF